MKPLRATTWMGFSEMWPITRDPKLYDSIYVKYPEKVKLSWLPGAGSDTNSKMGTEDRIWETKVL